MKRKGLHYVTPALGRQIGGLIDQLSDGTQQVKPDDVPYRLGQLLPIEKLKQETIHRRVEGFFLASNLLFDRLMSECLHDRRLIISQAGLRSMGFYHYITGSREPAEYMETRDDVLNDPAAAIVKLSEDIVGMANLLAKKKPALAEQIPAGIYPVISQNLIQDAIQPMA